MDISRSPVESVRNDFKEKLIYDGIETLSMLRTSEIVPPDQVSISIDALITMKINAGRWAVHLNNSIIKLVLL